MLIKGTGHTWERHGPAGSNPDSTCPYSRLGTEGLAAAQLLKFFTSEGHLQQMGVSENRLNPIVPNG